MTMETQAVPGVLLGLIFQALAGSLQPGASQGQLGAGRLRHGSAAALQMDAA